MIHKKEGLYNCNSSRVEKKLCFEIHGFKSQGNKKFLIYTSSFYRTFSTHHLVRVVGIICIILHQ